MKVLIIGGGHIGGAVALGACCHPEYEITVSSRTEETLRKFSGTGIKTVLAADTSLEGYDMVVLAVRTQQVQAVMESCRDQLRDRLLVCMAAQVTPQYMSQYCNRLVYAIPNTAAQFGKSVTFVSNISSRNGDMEIIKRFFGSVGECLQVEYPMLKAGISLASCGIAYAMKYMAAATDAALCMGFEKDEAIKAVCGTVAGAIEVVVNHAYDVKHQLSLVATPGGLTEKGLRAMDESGFDKAVYNGLTASTK